MDQSELIMKEMYANTQPCGRDFTDVEFFPYRKTNISKEVPVLPYLIPHDTYHPEIAIGIDFTHKFVQTTKQLEGEDLVDLDWLRVKAVPDLVRFVKTYFENITLYGLDSGETTSYFTYNIEKDPANLHEQNKFLNTILNYFLTSIQVTRNRTDIGTASITLKDNRNLKGGVSDQALFVHAAAIYLQLFVPMLPVTIWAKGRFYRNYFFPIFDGYITAVSPTDTAGFAEIKIECRDVFELARISSELINPALVIVGEDRKTQAVNFMNKPFFGHDHHKIIETMFRGGHLVFDPTGKSARFENEITLSGGLFGKWEYVYDKEKNRLVKKEIAPGLFKSVGSTISNAVTYLAKKTGLKSSDDNKNKLDFMKLENFEYASSNDPAYVDMLPEYLESSAVHKTNLTMEYIVNNVSHTKRQRKLILWGANITPYRIWSLQSVPLFTTDFSSRLDVIREIASMVYFDCYADGAGNVHYHPFRFINKYLMNDAIYLKPNKSKFVHPDIWPGVQVISPEETIGVNTTFNSEEMITFLRLTGQDPFIAELEPELGNIIGTALDRKFISRFGYRRQVMHNPLFNRDFSLDPNSKKIKEAGLTFGDIAAVSMLKFANAQLYTKDATIVFRPEINVARPTYFTEDNTVFYVNSITHNVTIGGNATTTVSASFGRKDWELPADLYSFILQTQKIFQYGEQEVDPEDIIRNLPAFKWEEFLTNEARDIYLRNYAATGSLSEQQSSYGYETDLA
jgi:hypothetical protein